MTTDHPSVSVVLAVFDAERFLAAAIESVRAQTLSDWELVVIDDGSQDRSGQIAEEIASTDARIVVAHQPNQGHPSALNSGVAIARAPLIARLDADDLMPPERLASQLAFLRGHERVAVVGGAVTFIDESGRPFAEDVAYPLSDGDIRRVLEYATPLAHPGVMFRKAVFDRVGGYRRAFAPSEDLDLWLRIAEIAELANLPETVVLYRMHRGQSSLAREQQVIGSLAARISALARREGRAEPFSGVESVDYDGLIAAGVSPAAFTEGFVTSTTWVARMMTQAGYPEVATELFAAAAANAQSASGSSALVDRVRRAQGGVMRGRLRRFLR